MAGLISVSGLASGLDTQGIISQLMQLERLPLTKLQQRQAQLRRVDEVWGQVNTKLSSLRTSLDKVRQTKSFDAFVAVSSSNTDAVVATKNGTPATGAVSFTVDQLAQAHQFSFANSFSSGSDLVGAGEVVLEQGGTEYRVTTTDTTTLDQLASELNRVVPGAASSVVKVSDGVFRLMVTSRETGTAKAITVTGNPPSLGGINSLQAALDAKLTIGTGASAMAVTRSSNTITDLVDGVSLELKKPTTTAVSVTTNRDLDGAVGAVKGLVDALNGVLTKLRDESKYDPATKKGGPLAGDATARQLVSDLRMAMSDLVGGVTGDYTAASSVGITMERDGTFKLDETKLRDALGKDFNAVAKLFTRTTATSDARLRVASAAADVPKGTYAVEITAAATRAAIIGSAYTTPAAGDPQDFTITTAEGVAVAISITDAEATTADAVAKINATLSAAGVTSIVASDSGGAIQLEESRYGSAPAFTVSSSTGDAAFGLLGTHSGSDIAGTIGGAAATGTGRTLTGSGSLAGLIVEITTNDVGGFGSVTVSDGIGGAVDAALKLGEGSEGSVQRTRNALTSQIGYYDTRIADFEVRLASRQKTLQQKFTALESALAKMQGATAGILGQMAARQQQ